MRKISLPILGAILGTLWSLSALAAPMCDVLKVEFVSGERVFAGSAFAIRTSVGATIVTADHVFPSDAQPSRIRLSLNNAELSDAVILKRDWSSDLMLLQPTDTAAARKLRPCLSEKSESPELGQGARLRMRGYPASSLSAVEREAVVGDPSSPEIRLPRPVPLIQVVGLPEKGMSGGVLEALSGVVVGVLVQDWYSANNALKGGAYAIPATNVVRRAREMLAAGGDGALEMPAPYLLRRDAEELVAYGFRFRTIDNPFSSVQPLSRRSDGFLPARDNVILARGGGGGHPDGIGGDANRTALEVIGLSGDEVPQELKALERVLRRVQSQGGMEMLVLRTEDAKPARSVTELARLILESNGAPIRLEYSLRSISPERPAPGAETLDTLVEQAVVDVFRLADLNVELKPLAALAQRSFNRWVAERSVSAVKDFLDAVRSYDDALDRILDLQPGAWSRVIEFRVRIQKISRKLGE